MASLIYARRAVLDLERFAKFLQDDGPEVARFAIDVIAEAVEILERHPLIGRRCEEDLRELVIGRGKFGYVALYDYYPDDDLVVILAIRHQREAGYAE